MKLFLNNGIDLDTNTTIIPRASLEIMTSAHSIAVGSLVELSDSIIGYGLGWARFSLAGHDVCSSTFSFVFLLVETKSMHLVAIP